MSSLRVVTYTQRIVVDSAQNVRILNAGPPGPPGVSGVPAGGTDGQVLGKSGTATAWLDVGTSDEIDTKIAAHDQAQTVHTNAQSGRDFAALFLNGLV